MTTFSRPVHVSLFSGVGMTDLAAAQEGFQTIAQAESNAWCREVLAARFPDAVRFPDVSLMGSVALRAHTGFLGRVDLLSGGFPCQDASDAGTKLGLSGHRTGLWDQMMRVIDQLQPSYVLGENVASLRKRGLDIILHDLWNAGYDVRWECIPAAYVGAPHLRDRCWIMARRRALGLNFNNNPAADQYLGAVWDGRNDYSSLPRAGRMIGGVLYATTPLTTVRDARGGRKLLPTPTKSDGTGGPGTTPKRTGGKNLRTYVNELCGNGRLNPLFIEWMMGLPLHWTDTEQLLGPVLPWDPPMNTANWTTGKHVKHRSERIQALGNGLVPQVARVALRILLND